MNVLLANTNFTFFYDLGFYFSSEYFWYVKKFVAAIKLRLQN